MRAIRKTRAVCGTLAQVLLLLSAILPSLSCGALAQSQVPNDLHDLRDLQAVVTLFVTVPRSIERTVGSGAFISTDGEILTCYHVIERARNIEVLTALQQKGTALVEWYSPEQDLAILRLQGARVPGVLRIAPQKPPHLLGLPLQIYGWLQGLASGALTVDSTHDEEQLADKLVFLPQEKDHNHVSKPGERIIMLHTTIARGVSGAPLVAPQGIIGVVLGTERNYGVLSWAAPVAGLDPSKLKRELREPSSIAVWPPLATRFGSALNMSATISDTTRDAEQGFLNAIEKTRAAFPAFREAVRAYTDNSTEMIKAMGQIPAASRQKRSSEIANDPRLREINQRIGFLFQQAAEENNQFAAARAQLMLAATEADEKLAALGHAAVASGYELDTKGPSQQLLDSVGAQIQAAETQLKTHPMPQIKTPAVSITDADSVSVEVLRQYLIETRANMLEVLTPAFQQGVEDYLFARQSAALPFQRIIQANSRGESPN